MTSAQMSCATNDVPQIKAVSNREDHLTNLIVFHRRINLSVYFPSSSRIGLTCHLNFFSVPESRRWMLPRWHQITKRRDGGGENGIKDVVRKDEKRGDGACSPWRQWSRGRHISSRATAPRTAPTPRAPRAQSSIRTIVPPERCPCRRGSRRTQGTCARARSRCPR